MLRLERSSPFHEEIAVRFRSRESFVTRPLLIGLGIALLFHLLFFLTVQFHSYGREQLLLHPPIAVEIDLGPSDSNAMAASLQIDKHGLLPRYLVAPEPSRPELPPIHSGPLCWYSTPQKQSLDLGDSFAKAERHPYHLFPGRLLLPTRYEPIRISLAGTLSDRQFATVEMGDLTEPRVRYDDAETFCCQFEVSLEERTGQIFWIVLTDSCGYSPLDRRAEEIVRNIRVKGERGSWTTPGLVEVLFEVEEGDPLKLMEEPIDG